ncbi:MAG TPA: hypothetical protein VJN43_18030 [Bryobacteraceae bacterium]|nr:hypothetical protein [Bryobacteraceae bacterium]
MRSTSKVQKPSKLAELRTKTDRELVLLIDKQLELCLQFVLINHTSANDFGFAENSHMEARKIYARVVQLLARVDDPDEYHRLQQKMIRLQAALKSETRVRPAVSAAVG